MPCIGWSSLSFGSGRTGCRCGRVVPLPVPGTTPSTTWGWYGTGGRDSGRRNACSCCKVCRSEGYRTSSSTMSANHASQGKSRATYIQPSSLGAAIAHHAPYCPRSDAWGVFIGARRGAGYVGLGHPYDGASVCRGRERWCLDGGLVGGKGCVCAGGCFLSRAGILELCGVAEQTSKAVQKGRSEIAQTIPAPSTQDTIHWLAILLIHIQHDPLEPRHNYSSLPGTIVQDMQRAVISDEHTVRGWSSIS